MLNERTDTMDSGYKCNRCGGTFGSHNENIVRCPFCSMICDEVKCRVTEISSEEY